MSSPISKQRLNTLPGVLDTVSSAQQTSDMRPEIASTISKIKHSPTCSVLERRLNPVMKLDPRYDLKSEMKSELCTKSQNVENKKTHPLSPHEKRFVKRAKLSNNTETHTKEVSFICKHCSSTFSDKSQLSVHLRPNKNKKPNKCHYCLQTFILKCQLDMHLQSHSGARFTCTLCAKEFIYKYALEYHFRRKHTKERPFKCHRCSSMFYIKKSLVNHLRTHTDELPLTCWYCNKLFSHRDLLIEHARTHTDDKAFVCDHCGKKMNYRKPFLRHVQAHTGKDVYACLYCEKRFIHRVWYTRHMRIHQTSLNDK